MADKTYSIRSLVNESSYSHSELACALGVSDDEFEELYNCGGASSEQYGILKQYTYEGDCFESKPILANDKKPPALYLYPNFRSMIAPLQDEVAGKLIKALINYFETQECYNGDNEIVKAIFNGLKTSIDDSIKKYVGRCESNSRAARAKWDKAKE